MSVVMFAVGAVLSLAGVFVIAAGLPDKEFSFGNTLIIAGTICFVGGLIVIALGMVAMTLRRLIEARTTDHPVRELSLGEPVASAAPASAARIPFPPKPKAAPLAPAPEMDEFEDMPPAEPAREPAREPSRTDFSGRDFAPLPQPMLPNPAEPPMMEEEAASEATLSPRQGQNGRPPFERPEPLRFEAPKSEAPKSEAAKFEPPKFEPPKFSPVPPAAAPSQAPERARPRSEGWRPLPETGRPEKPIGDSRFFEAMWPSRRGETSAPAPAEFAPPPATASPRPETIARASAPIAPEPPLPESRIPDPIPEPEPDPIEEETVSASSPGVVPVLKSGVVDGMAYTLFVDGSIEAELESGVLHFASINELRAHLDATRAR